MSTASQLKTKFLPSSTGPRETSERDERLRGEEIAKPAASVLCLMSSTVQAWLKERRAGRYYWVFRSNCRSRPLPRLIASSSALCASCLPAKAA